MLIKLESADYKSACVLTCFIHNKDNPSGQENFKWCTISPSMKLLLRYNIEERKGQVISHQRKPHYEPRPLILPDASDRLAAYCYWKPGRVLQEYRTLRILHRILWLLRSGSSSNQDPTASIQRENHDFLIIINFQQWFDSLTIEIQACYIMVSPLATVHEHLIFCYTAISNLPFSYLEQGLELDHLTSNR